MLPPCVIYVSFGNPLTAPVGIYSYTLSFDLTGLDYLTAVIAGTWASDNNSTILLNGVSTGYTKGTGGYGTLESFNLTSGFISGLNTLTFNVTNDTGATGNPTGLQVNIIRTDADLSPVPEPSTMLLLGFGMVGLAGVVRKKIKK